MEGSRKEVMRFMRLVVAEFQIPDERTQTAKMQDWAVNLAWGGSDELAKSGMMNIMRREGGRQIDTGTYDGEKLERLRLLGQALQRYTRRRVAECELQAIHSRVPAPELYWAVVGERYSWECTGDGPVDGALPPRLRSARDTESGAHMSRHATSVERMNDGAAGGSARRHNDD